MSEAGHSALAALARLVPTLRDNFASHPFNKNHRLRLPSQVSFRVRYGFKLLCHCEWIADKNQPILPKKYVTSGEGRSLIPVEKRLALFERYPRPTQRIGESSRHFHSARYFEAAGARIRADRQKAEGREAQAYARRFRHAEP